MRWRFLCSFGVRSQHRRGSPKVDVISRVNLCDEKGDVGASFCDGVVTHLYKNLYLRCVTVSLMKLGWYFDEIEVTCSGDQFVHASRAAHIITPSMSICEKCPDDWDRAHMAPTATHFT